MIGFLPKGRFPARGLVAKVIAMVRPEHDDGILRPAGFVELIEQAAHHLVGEIGSRLVALDHFL